MKPIGLKKTLGISNVFLDDLTRALTEEQIVASKELKMRAALKKSFQSLCPLVLF